MKWADLDAPFDDPRWDDIASVARRDLRGMLDRTRAEATAAAEQRLRERITAELQPGNEHGLTYQAGRNAGLRKALALLDAPPPASPRQGEPVEVDRLARAIDAAWRREGSDHHLFGPGLADEGRKLAALIAAEWPDA